MTVAIVTGGASGIGRAIAAALVERGARVVIADINAEAARLAAKRLTEAAGLAAKQLTETAPGRADAVCLDVTDGAAVLACYRAVAAEHGRLDLVFNNAGIAIGGVTEEFTLDHWDRVIDVNLRGVVHGVHAAYPIMLAQGRGHIVNTASLAGLVQPAIMIPYTVTKSAVVALSVALRAEGAARGVRVSVLCPGFVDTPLLDNVNPGLPPTGVNDKTRRVIGRLQPRMYTADRLAVDVMRGVARNKPIILAPASARVAALVARYTPAIAQAVNRQQVRRYLREGA